MACVCVQKEIKEQRERRQKSRSRRETEERVAEAAAYVSV